MIICNSIIEKIGIFMLEYSRTAAPRIASVIDIVSNNIGYHLYLSSSEWKYIIPFQKI